MKITEKFKWIYQTIGMMIFFLFIISIPISFNYLDFKNNKNRYIIEIKFCDNMPSIVDTVMEYPKIRLFRQSMSEFQDQKNRIFGYPCKQYVNVCDIRIIKHYKIK